MNPNEPRRKRFIDNARPLAFAAEVEGRPVSFPVNPVLQLDGAVGYTGGGTLFVTIGGVVHECSVAIKVLVKTSRTWGVPKKEKKAK